LRWEAYNGTGDVVTFIQNWNMMLVAYIDAALGSMLLQAMGGMILAGIVMGRRIFAVPFAWMNSKSATEANGELQEVTETSIDQ
jgi:hypothetical protein